MNCQKSLRTVNPSGIASQLLVSDLLYEVSLLTFFAAFVDTVLTNWYSPAWFCETFSALISNKFPLFREFFTI